MAAAAPERIAKIERVLVTTDFSELARAAIPYAFALVARGGTVHLLHVVEPVVRPNPLYAHYTPGRTPTPAERAAQLAELRERLAGLVPPDARERGIATELELAEGHDVAEQVRAVAERIGADVLCMASHGRSGLARTLLGSVAEEVLHRTRRPLFVVPSPRS
jgi:nucleotide-binding universal stress UspA family protein